MKSLFTKLIGAGMLLTQSCADYGVTDMNKLQSAEEIVVKQNGRSSDVFDVYVDNDKVAKVEHTKMATGQDVYTLTSSSGEFLGRAKEKKWRMSPLRGYSFKDANDEYVFRIDERKVGENILKGDQYMMNFYGDGTDQFAVAQRNSEDLETNVIRSTSDKPMYVIDKQNDAYVIKVESDAAISKEAAIIYTAIEDMLFSRK